MKDIENAGYNNYWRVLNAKDYSIPQNRERVFVVSIRKDIDKCFFNFPDKQFLEIRLKDLLERSVDDKYYLSDKAIGRLVKCSNRLIRKLENPNISAYLVANYFKMGARDEQYIKDDKVKRIIGIFDEGNKKHQAGSIYDEKGISPTLTGASGGHIQPHIFVRKGTKNGYTEAIDGDSINVSYPMNIKKRGRVGKQVAQTILASNINMATLEKINKIDLKLNTAFFITEDGKQCFRIRKLTPKECWRLMRFFR